MTKQTETAVPGAAYVSPKAEMLHLDTGASLTCLSVNTEAFSDVDSEDDFIW